MNVKGLMFIDINDECSGYIIYINEFNFKINIYYIENIHKRI